MNKSLSNTFFLIFALEIFTISCTKKSEPIVFEEEPLSVKSPSQFSANINGFDIFIMEEKTADLDIFTSYSGGGYYPGYTGSAILGSSLNKRNPDTTITPIVTIKKGTLNFNNYTMQRFKLFFQEGTYQFSVNASNGFQIDFYDSAGVHWSTSKAPGIQLVNNFKIVESKGSFPNDVEHVRIKAEFSCYLYNDDEEVIEVIDGIFIGTFKNI